MVSHSENTRLVSGNIEMVKLISRFNSKVCVNSIWVQIEQSLFVAAAGLSGCRLANNITPVGVDVNVRPPAVLLGHALGKVYGHLGMDQASVLTAYSLFWVISIMAKYSIFSRLSSVRNADLALVTLRSWRLNPSMALVV